MADEQIFDGRYTGGSESLSVELRIDLEVSGLISADVYRVRGEERIYAASVRTAQPVETAEAAHSAMWQLNPELRTTGTITMEPGGKRVILRLDEELNRLPGGTDLVVDLTRAGDEPRELGLEIEVEEGVRLPQPFPFQGAEVTLQECLHRAGFSVRPVGEQSVVPKGLDGQWTDSAIYSALDAIMRSSGKNPVVPAWELRLLVLSKAQIANLAGIMFDYLDTLPRQGAAVFAGAIGADDRRLIRTMTHELGHALNLAHRFEREVGRRDSTSFMNYPQRYVTADGSTDYWSAFTFTFDPDELAFVRHGPLGAVIPGGEPFHSVRYWTGGPQPSLNPEADIPGARLSLTAPSPTFAFGQPVFLKVSLTNTGQEPIEDLDPALLDPKGDFLQIMIKRRNVETVFVPGVQRCMDTLQPDRSVTIGPGQSIDDNLQLSFGAGGFTFAEPGDYDVTPELVLTRKIEGTGLVDFIVRGDTLRITVEAPARDAEVLMRPDVGTLFALGGSDALGSAADALREVKERRLAEIGAHDPVVAAIVRTEGLNAGRPSVGLRDDRLVTRAADPSLAADLLGSLDAAALRTFDPVTAASTVRLARTYAAEAPS